MKRTDVRIRMIGQIEQDEPKVTHQMAKEWYKSCMVHLMRDDYLNAYMALETSFILSPLAFDETDRELLVLLRKNLGHHLGKKKHNLLKISPSQLSEAPN